jgi:hypothetical protein
VILIFRSCLKKKDPDSRYYQDLNLSALVGIQTPNLLIRSQMLYSVELQVRYFEFGGANVKNNIFWQKKWFCHANKKPIFDP